MRYAAAVETVFNRRNAAVGFVTMKALSRYLDRRKKQRKRRGSRFALLALVGLLSLGVAVGLAYAWRRASAGTAEALEDAREAATDAVEAAREMAQEAAEVAEPVTAT